MRESKPMTEDAIAAFLAEVGSVAPAPAPPMSAAELEDLVDPAPIPETTAEALSAAFEPETLLDYLAEREAQAAALRLTMEAELDAVLTPQQREAMAKVRATYGPRIEEAQADAADMRAAIVDLVKARGATVKGSRLQAVYAKGRVSWDPKALDGYAKAHPELLEYRTQGEPSVSIRAVK